MPGMGELIVILLIVLVVFGASKLPAIGDALGRSIKNFKRATAAADDAADDDAAKQDSKGGKSLAAGKGHKQLDAGAGDDGEWEEVVVRRKKKSASDA